MRSRGLSRDNKGEGESESSVVNRLLLFFCFSCSLKKFSGGRRTPMATEVTATPRPHDSQRGRFPKRNHTLEGEPSRQIEDQHYNFLLLCYSSFLHLYSSFIPSARMHSVASCYNRHHWIWPIQREQRWKKCATHDTCEAHTWTTASGCSEDCHHLHPLCTNPTCLRHHHLQQGHHGSQRGGAHQGR
jgi:hypothetical protein